MQSAVCSGFGNQPVGSSASREQGREGERPPPLRTPLYQPPLLSSQQTQCCLTGSMPADLSLFAHREHRPWRIWLWGPAADTWTFLIRSLVNVRFPSSGFNAARRKASRQESSSESVTPARASVLFSPGTNKRVKAILGESILPLDICCRYSQRGDGGTV